MLRLAQHERSISHDFNHSSVRSFDKLRTSSEVVEEWTKDCHKSSINLTVHPSTVVSAAGFFQTSPRCRSPKLAIAPPRSSRARPGLRSRTAPTDSSGLKSIELNLSKLAHAHVHKRTGEPELLARLEDPGYEARIEHAIVFTVLAWDWNCSQAFSRSSIIAW
jgi:hypothetical protein